jgi:hypothetical protein
VVAAPPPIIIGCPIDPAIDFVLVARTITGNLARDSMVVNYAIKNRSAGQWSSPTAHNAVLIFRNSRTREVRRSAKPINSQGGANAFLAADRVHLEWAAADRPHVSVEIIIDPPIPADSAATGSVRYCDRMTANNRIVISGADMGAIGTASRTWRP